MSVLRFLSLALLAMITLSSGANAHEGRPLYVEIDEQEGDLYFLRWRVPSTIEAGNTPSVVMPDTCTRVEAPETISTFTGNVGQGLFQCVGGLSDVSLEISYPRTNPSVSTLMRLTRQSGEVQIVRVGPGEPTLYVEAAENMGSVASEYLVLGIEHILLGYDHLLFVACLLMIAGTFRRVLVMITGFTLAHSITLGLAAMDLVTVPIPPLEAAIALSIVFLAAELIRDDRTTLTWRFPFIISVGFGFLHGFGFAAVLGEIGLPQTEVPAALFFFNLGVEVGQVAFIMAASALFIAVKYVLQKAGRMVSDHDIQIMERPIGYVVGTIAAFWTVERVASFFA